MRQGRVTHYVARPFFLLALLFAPPLFATASQTINETAAVARVIDGDTLVLTDGVHVRLDGINALEIPHRPEESDRCLPSTRTQQPENFGCDLTYANAAKAMLEKLTDGKTVRLQINPQRRTDRYGRLLAQIFVTNESGKEISATEQLVTAGLAHVYPLSGQEIDTPRLIALEAKARAAHRDIWQLPEFQPTPAEQAQTQYGHYTLIEGRVTHVKQIKNRLFLNFGQDYRSDFSAIIEQHDWKNFSGFDLPALQGQRLRLRGFLHEDYGPAMRLSNAEQIEVLP